VYGSEPKVMTLVEEKAAAVAESLRNRSPWLARQIAYINPNFNIPTAFAEQIQLAHEHELSLVIHTRDAWDETFEILDAEGIPSNTIMHCFSGDEIRARQCVERGLFLSFSGIVTFKNANDLREAALFCPDENLLVETDSPYLAPVPHRGKMNQPALVSVVGTSIAELRQSSPEHIAHITSVNALRAFPKMRAAA
jgi:TatD DNase family protein